MSCEILRSRCVNVVWKFGKNLICLFSKMYWTERARVYELWKIDIYDVYIFMYIIYMREIDGLVFRSIYRAEKNFRCEYLFEILRLKDNFLAGIWDVRKWKVAEFVFFSAVLWVFHKYFDCQKLRIIDIAKHKRKTGGWYQSKMKFSEKIIKLSGEMYQKIYWNCYTLSFKREYDAKLLEVVNCVRCFEFVDWKINWIYIALRRILHF